MCLEDFVFLDGNANSKLCYFAQNNQYLSSVLGIFIFIVKKIDTVPYSSFFLNEQYTVVKQA